MRAHLVQFDIAWEDKPANFRAVEKLVGGAGVSPGDVVVLPELFDTGFSYSVAKNADQDGSTLTFLRDLARTRKVCVHGSRTVLVGDGLAVKGRGLNRSTVVGPDGAVVCEYDKIHPFTPGGEAAAIVAGTRVVTYRWAGMVVAPTICYDLRFPELFRAATKAGAEMLVVTANWPAVRIGHWRALLIARAIENQAYVLGVNRVGSDPNVSYPGVTMAVSPKGEVLGELGGESGVLSVEIDPEQVRRWRAAFPVLADAKL